MYEKEVYADILFMINFSMDFLVFYILSRIMHLPLRARRAILASAVGGVYAVAAVIYGSGGTFSLIFDLAVCVLMVSAVYVSEGMRLSKIAILCGMYFVISMLLGGVMTFAFDMFNRMNLPIEGIEGDDSVSVWVFAVCAIISACLSLWSGRVRMKENSIERCKVEITMGDRCVTLDGIFDSGNLLREPTTGRAVVVVDTKSVEELLPREIAESIKKGSEMEIEKHMGKGRFLVPAETAVGSGLMLAFAPDKMKIIGEHGDAHETNALFALSAIGRDGYSALVPTELKF